jgi:hypothetical protein
MNSHQAVQESAMSLQNLLTRITGLRRAQPAPTIDYDELFAGAATAPIAMAGNAQRFLLGLRAVENDVDAYFKDVFGGPIF